MSEPSASPDPPNGLAPGDRERPLLLVDVDGVISLFGFDPKRPPEGSWQIVDGVAHLLSATAAQHLRRLQDSFELAWCTGWEEKADEYLPQALGLSDRFPYLSFAAAEPTVQGHWKLEAIDRYTGSERAVAWIDDAHDAHCRSWAETRPGPTLLVTTDPACGLTAEQVERLERWAAGQFTDTE